MRLLPVLTAIFLSVTIHLTGQVFIRLDSIPAYTPVNDDIYIAGNFNGWNPGDPNYLLEKDSLQKWHILLGTQPEGTVIEYKFTRGSWGTVEKGINGEEIPNRTFTFGNGDTLNLVVWNWADAGGGNSTAQPNVVVLEEEFFMPQLNRNRTIRAYLPPDYESSGKNYPVIYMHDGQNLFDDYTAFAGEWHVDETLNDLFDEGYPVPIIIGIDNGGEHRIDEYTPWPNSQYGGGQGELYTQFIIETLKPWVDSTLRTKPEREFTGIWGSSLGGLISHYIFLSHSDVFGFAGIFSPSYWFSDSVWDFTHNAVIQFPARIYQATGSLEGNQMTTQTEQMHDTLLTKGFSSENLFTVIRSGAGHIETFWAGEFSEAFLWLTANWAGIGDNLNTGNKVVLFPNPVRDKINAAFLAGFEPRRIIVRSLDGKVVLDKELNESHGTDISMIPDGVYLVTFKGKNLTVTRKIVKCSR
ncbi:MAG: hypothetical protein Kow00127_05870 [Bacteroidales bacterium]